jgi:hypothetical protein
MFVTPTSNNRKMTCLLANCKKERYTKIDGIVLREVWIENYLLYSPLGSPTKQNGHVWSLCCGCAT